MNSEEQLELIFATCNRILELDDEKDEPVMGLFCSHTFIKENKNARKKQFNRCGTAMCIAGILAHNADYPKVFRYEEANGEFRFDYSAYSLELLGEDPSICTSSSDVWTWLFDDYWEDDLSHAKARAQYLLDNNGEVPPDFDTGNDLRTNQEYFMEKYCNL